MPKSIEVNNTYNKASDWVNRNLGWLILLIIIIAIATALVSNANKDYLEIELEKCQAMVAGDLIKNGYDGNCELYLGSDNKTHYVYHSYGNPSADNDGKYYYYNWETMEKGKY